MNCKHAEELLPLYAGRDLDDRGTRLVASHLESCAACAQLADEYRESVQSTQQFAPPVFAEGLYSGMRQRVLREIKAEAGGPGWSQIIAGIWRPRFNWAVASVLLIAVSAFAIYFIVNRGGDSRNITGGPSVRLSGGNQNAVNGTPSKEPAHAGPSANPGQKDQERAAIGKPRRQKHLKAIDNRSSNVAKTTPDVRSTTNVSPNENLPAPTLSPVNDSTTSEKPIRVEIQTADPNIRIIWFTQAENKPSVPSSKGT